MTGSKVESMTINVEKGHGLKVGNQIIFGKKRGRFKRFLALLGLYKKQTRFTVSKIDSPTTITMLPE